MSSAVLSLPRLVLVALVFALGFGLGNKAGQAPLKVELAEARATAAETGRLQAMAAARALTDAQALGNTLTDRLAVRQAQISNLEAEKRRAIAHYTSGRHCLSSDAVRVLNASPNPDAPAGLPGATGSADAADGAFATDTDVGQWIATTQAQYDTCRGRLDALIDFNTHQPGVLP